MDPQLSGKRAPDTGSISGIRSGPVNGMLKPLPPWH